MEKKYFCKYCNYGSETPLKFYDFCSLDCCFHATVDLTRVYSGLEALAEFRKMLETEFNHYLKVEIKSIDLCSNQIRVTESSGQIVIISLPTYWVRPMTENEVSVTISYRGRGGFSEGHKYNIFTGDLPSVVASRFKHSPCERNRSKVEIISGKSDLSTDEV